MASDLTSSDLLASSGRISPDGRSPQRVRSLDGRLEALTMLEMLCVHSTVPEPVKVRHLRELLASETRRGDTTEALTLLDAVLDSPLDLNAAVFQRILPTLPAELQRDTPLARPHVRFENAQQARLVPPVSSAKLPPRPEWPQEWGALASQMRSMNRVMLRQTKRIRQGLHNAEAENTPQDSTATGTSSRPAEKTPTTSEATAIRGLHIRQGGHHFVLPISKIERALDVRASGLPTVRGKPVVQFEGVLCDVVHLAGYLGLISHEETVAKSLLVVAESGTRVCLAIDEVLGPVETVVTPMATILPKVTSLLGVATLDSGGLALVPDLSRLVPATV